MKKCVVLLSGGLDSTTALLWARARYGEVRALTFDYGQRHRGEIRAARRTARRLGVPQAVLRLDLASVGGGSALTDRSIPLPRHRRVPRLKKDPPPTYVPFRNGIFLALAAAWAEARGITDLVCGFNVVDSPAYPDTSRAFVRAMSRAVNAGTRSAFGPPRLRIVIPFLTMKKSDIIGLGLRLGADYADTVTCYAGTPEPCGACSACLLRARAFRQAGRPDPLARKPRPKERR
ncbi:MAG: 7-cyano-7-deazaguanine synthase QueC [Candidatus Aminicenantes bacterium]|nr:7-cyano-7-deazaguanine synthase QueC [Candidatus Aminicenantes bacterium]